MTEEKKIVEIQGVKFEVDLRHARVVENFRIGDRIKVLKKEYGETHNVYPGVIVGFENFKMLPTIVIAYLKTSYGEASLEFDYFNAESKDMDLVVTDDGYLPIEKADIIERFDREIQKKEEALADIKRRKTYFLEHFQRYFQLIDG